MALYTGKGDGGTTKLFSTPSGVRISKGSGVFEALGRIDALNSFLGLCAVKGSGIVVAGLDVAEMVVEIQHALFIVQAEVAGSDKCVRKQHVDTLEHHTNAIEKILPPITTFTVSGGSELSALFDIARTTARDAERAVVRALDAQEIVAGDMLKAFLNRLSSFLYALARGVNEMQGIRESNPHY